MPTETIFPAHEPNRTTLTNAAAFYEREEKVARTECRRATRELTASMKERARRLAGGFSEAELDRVEARLVARIRECKEWAMDAASKSTRLRGCHAGLPRA